MWDFLEAYDHDGRKIGTAIKEESSLVYEFGIYVNQSLIKYNLAFKELVYR